MCSAAFIKLRIHFTASAAQPMARLFRCRLGSLAQHPPSQRGALAAFFCSAFATRAFCTGAGSFTNRYAPGSSRQLPNRASPPSAGAGTANSLCANPVRHHPPTFQKILAAPK